jgi:hypothetical protein
MSTRTAKWLACTVGAALIGATVTFLALQGLSGADSWSSIGAFLTALVTAVIGAVAWLFRRTTAPASSNAVAPPRTIWRVLNLFNRKVIVADHSHVVIREKGEAAHGRGRKCRRLRGTV